MRDSTNTTIHLTRTLKQEVNNLLLNHDRSKLVPFKCIGNVPVQELNPTPSR